MDRKKIGILASRDSWYARDLLRAAGQLRSPLEIQLLSFAELAAMLDSTNRLGLQAGTHEVSDRSNESARIDCLQQLDALLVRTMPMGSLEQVIFRMDCLRLAEDLGKCVLNSSRSLETAIDKWLTLHRLSLRGVPAPATIVCQTRESAMQAFEQLGGDVLVKPLFGGEGRGILRIQNADMAWRSFGTLQQLGQVMYVQEYLDHLGYDIRVLAIGDTWYTIRRWAASDNWRTNISQGGTAEAVSLDDELRPLVQNCLSEMGEGIFGIDLLPLRRGGVVVLEVNAVPGWKGLARALNIDISRRLLEYIAGRIAHSGRNC